MSNRSEIQQRLDQFLKTFLERTEEARTELGQTSAVQAFMKLTPDEVALRLSAHSDDLAGPNPEMLDLYSEFASELCEGNLCDEDRKWAGRELTKRLQAYLDIEQARRQGDYQNPFDNPISRLRRTGQLLMGISP